MIAYLQGLPAIIDNQLVLICNGVGYGVHVTNATLSNVSTLSQASLHIYTHVKEESLELFGFETSEEKKLFTILLSVNGVGPRTALSILEKGASTIVTAVQQAQVAVFSSVPRVGKKVAQKIIIELTPKLGSLKQLQLTPLTTFQSELSEALLSLGFSDAAIDEIVRDEALEQVGLSQALQLCLKKLSN